MVVGGCPGVEESAGILQEKYMRCGPNGYSQWKGVFVRPDVEGAATYAVENRCYWGIPQCIIQLGCASLRRLKGHKPNKYYARGPMGQINTNVAVTHVWLMELDLIPPSTGTVPASIQPKDDWSSWKLLTPVPGADTTEDSSSSWTSTTSQPAAPSFPQQSYTCDRPNHDATTGSNKNMLPGRPGQTPMYHVPATSLHRQNPYRRHRNLDPRRHHPHRQQSTSQGCRCCSMQRHQVQWP